MIKVKASSPKASAKQGKGTKNARKPRHSTTKLSELEALLRRAEGATIAQLVSALGWQSHSVRGAMSGSLRKKRGITVASEKGEGEERVYRIVA